MFNQCQGLATITFVLYDILIISNTWFGRHRCLRYCQFETWLLQLTFVQFIGREHSKTATSSEYIGKMWLGQDQEQVPLPCCRDCIGFQLTTVFDYSLQNLNPHPQDFSAAANIPTTTTLQIHSITFFAIRRTDATDHSKNQHQNRNQSLQCGSTNHLEQSSSKCQGHFHTRNISVTFEDTLFSRRHTTFSHVATIWL